MGFSKQSVFSNLIWRFAERVGAQLVSFVVSIVLARLLMPEDYGTIALMMSFISILQVFVDSGLGNALIQKKDADDTDFSTVFYTNIFFCFILYLLVFLLAPLIASFYKNQYLVKYLRVLAITILISGVKNVQQAYVSKMMIFKRFFWSTLVGTLISAVIGIFMAYKGFGVWALVAQHLSNATIDTLMLWLTVGWRPKSLFSLTRLKTLFSFGWKLLMSGLIYTTYNNLRQLVIGKCFTSSDLAFFNRGDNLANVVVANINSSIDSVLLPTLSSEQDDIARVKSLTSRAIKTSTYVMAPLMMGLAATAPNVVTLLLTDKWLPCVFYLRIFCITNMFMPIHTANLNALQALGRSDLFLKLEIFKEVVGTVIIFISMWFGVRVLACSLILNSFICQIINAWPNKKLIRYSYFEQLKDILPVILLAVFMFGGVVCINLLQLPAWCILLIQVPVGIAIYILGSIVFKLDSFYYLVSLIRERLTRKQDLEANEVCDEH